MLNLNKKQKSRLIRIIISFSAFIILLVLSNVFIFESVVNQPIAWLLPCLLWFAIYLFIGYDVIVNAFFNIINGQIFDENFLMLCASLGAFVLGIVNGVSGRSIDGVEEAVAVLIFYQVGQFFESLATEKSRKSISEVLDIRPDYAHLVNGDKTETVFPDEVAVNELIAIYPGEKIPLDCTVIKGSSTIDNKSLTGESLPVEVKESSKLLSGGINLTGELICSVDKPYYESTVAKILDLVENASDKKSKAEKFTEKFARYYTPTVLILALLTALIPSFITGDWQTWIYRALSFLVVSCPCALVISVPMTFFVALGKASKSRILIKGSNYLEILAKSNIFVFDKTGTLTNGNFKVTMVLPSENQDLILKTACIAEKNSSHPIARSILEAYGKPVEENYSLTVLPGKGVIATNESEIIICGNKLLLDENEIAFTPLLDNAIYVAKNGVYLGAIVIEDTIKHNANEVIGALNEQNCKTVMLTGDNYEVASKVASECKISNFKANLLPQDKVSEIENILNAKQPGDTVCFIGDGVNDAPVLMRSDLGIAMGAIGSDAAIEAADVVLMKDDLSDIITAKRIAKKSVKIVKQNVIFSIFIKTIILILSFFGITNMWISIFGDVGVAILAILNAFRVNLK